MKGRDQEKKHHKSISEGPFSRVGKQHKIFKGLKRSTTMPMTPRAPIEEEEEKEGRLENELLLIGRGRDRMELFKRFKKSFNVNNRKQSMRRKFADNRKSMFRPHEDNKMNETVQSLDKLKKLDLDFAKRLKDAHFVISKDEDYMSSSYPDVIKDP